MVNSSVQLNKIKYSSIYADLMMVVEIKTFPKRESFQHKANTGNAQIVMADAKNWTV